MARSRRSAAELADVRRGYADAMARIVGERGLDPAAIRPAFAAVPRERLLGPPPWTILPADGGPARRPTRDPARLYEDVLVVLDAGRQVNNGQPSLHATWMAGVAPQPGEHVVLIGTGSGYYAAILAELVGPSGRVTGFEIDPRLAALAAANLAGRPTVVVEPTSALRAAIPPCDVVYVAAGAAAPAIGWLDALRPGGRLVMPWQALPRRGLTLRLDRTHAGFRARCHGFVSFVGCEGAGPGDRRSRGVPSRPVEETRSLRLVADAEPDGSATAIFDDMWFSADPV